MDKIGEEQNGFHLGKFEKRLSTFFQIYRLYVRLYLYQNVIYAAGKSFSVVTMYVAMILQMKDSWSAILKRFH